MRIVTGLVVTHLVSIDHVGDARLAGDDNHAAVRAAVFVDEHRTRRPQVQIRRRELFLIGGSEVIPHDETSWCKRELEHGVAVVQQRTTFVEGAVAGDSVHVSRRVSGEARVALPDSGFRSTRRRIEDANLAQSFCVVSDDPAMKRSDVAG